MPELPETDRRIKRVGRVLMLAQILVALFLSWVIWYGMEVLSIK